MEKEKIFNLSELKKWLVILPNWKQPISFKYRMDKDITGYLRKEYHMLVN